jgi:hypothetical protein
VASEMHGRTALYRHRDCNGTLLYVGISLSVAAHLAQHANTSRWFAEVTQHENGWGYKRREMPARWPNGRFPHELAAA